MRQLTDYDQLNCISSVGTSFEICLIGIVVNHLLVKKNWSDHVQKNSNSLAPRPAIRYFQIKHNDEVGYMGMNILLK